MTPVDEQILKRVSDNPGIAQSELVRNLMRTWSPAHIRGRVAILEARGTLRTTRDSGNRIAVFATGAIEA
jgi:predicted transcriptional regulator